MLIPGLRISYRFISPIDEGGGEDRKLLARGTESRATQASQVPTLRTFLMKHYKAGVEREWGRGDWLSDALKQDNPACYPLHLLLKRTKAQDPLSIQVTRVPEDALVFKPLWLDSMIL